ncbi:MAG: hydroxymethylglutaryl-CoA reductase, degradative [Bacteroidota bacterium]
MTAMHIISGFSKLSRTGKLKWLKDQASLSEQSLLMIHAHLHPDPPVQEMYDDISENTISNFFLPLGLAPNFLINGDLMTIPMVTEESSVVAAASHAAKFWAMNGGFHCEVKNVLKTGQVHFSWSGSQQELFSLFEKGKKSLLQSVSPFTASMEKRGGGIESMELRKTGDVLPECYQLFVTFRTADAMGANFINSVLEALAASFVNLLKSSGGKGEIIMAILSNYTPECLVTCSVEADLGALEQLSGGMTGAAFAEKFTRAVEIAIQDPYRAVTHNKGIFNGMDAVIVATGNDYRAAEACGHAYASREGRYCSLSRATCTGGRFSLSLEVPLALGTIGGLTATHPLAAASLEILGHPSSEKLMQIVAAAGLASNFSAIRSLITTGIQKGHMKMHLGNILRQLNASPEETSLAKAHFKQRTVSHAEVSAFIASVRNKPNHP